MPVTETTMSVLISPALNPARVSAPAEGLLAQRLRGFDENVICVAPGSNLVISAERKAEIAPFHSHVGIDSFQTLRIGELRPKVFLQRLDQNLLRVMVRGKCTCHGRDSHFHHLDSTAPWRCLTR